MKLKGMVVVAVFVLSVGILGVCYDRCFGRLATTPARPPLPRPQPDLDAAVLGPALATAVSSAVSTDCRLHALRCVNEPLTPARVEALQALALDVQSPIVVRSEALALLLTRKPDAPGTLAALLAAWDNPKEKLMGRDLILCGIGLTYDNTPADEQVAGRRLLLAVADNPATPRLAGAARDVLAGLRARHPELESRLQPEHPPFDTDERQDLDGVGLFTALRGRDRNVLPRARAIAADSNADTSLRVACILAIGRLGRERDIGFLANLQRGDNYVIISNAEEQQIALAWRLNRL